jgi:co-chaperonin GroES (HSP10)
MPLGKTPLHRVLITKDTNAPESVGGIILPLSLRPVNTGTIVQSGVEDIHVGDHVAFDDTLPSIPTIEIDGKPYIIMHKNDIKLIKH